MSESEKVRMQRAWRLSNLTLPVFVGLLLLSVTISLGRACAWTSDLVATPALMGSPLQAIESRMRSGQLQRFESRMPDSPLQLIGSPFGPYRFATLPNLQDLWIARRSISTLPAMFQTARGMLLLLPHYVVPVANRYSVVSSAPATEEAATSPTPTRPAAPPKFFSARCGGFVEMTIPAETNLTDEESKPC